MRATLISTTNPEFQFLEGTKGDIFISLVITFNFEPFKGTPFEMRRGDFRSSLIKKYTTEEISRNCYEMTFVTCNSTYVFRNGVYDKDTPPLTEDQKLTLAMSLIF